MTTRHVWAVVPAAGSGTRMGSPRPKQYLPLAGRSVLGHTLDVVLANPQVEGLVLVLAAADEEGRALAAGYGARVTLAAGGAQRQDSVLSGLAALADRAADEDTVLVHDAARPCLHRDDLARLLEELTGDPDGGLLATPVRDTLKRAGVDGRVAVTVSRDGLWQAQTPQVFPFGTLRRVLLATRERGRSFTDEAGAMEAAGYSPRLIAGRADNIKITLPEDLHMAERILNARIRAT